MAKSRQYRARVNVVVASAVQIQITEVNFGGYYGGGVPPWWPTTQIGTAFLRTVEVYGGSDSPDQVNGIAYS